MTGEVYKLQLEDVDLRGGFITFQGNRITQSRRIPISPDVRDLLKNYLQSKCRKGIRSTFVFVEKSGNPIRGKRLMEASLGFVVGQVSVVMMGRIISRKWLT